MSTAIDDVSDRLLGAYRQYVGEPEQLRDVYLGFGLFFGGIAFAAVGVLVFLWSATYPEGTSIFWQLRELAIALAALGLPAFLLSLVVLLPVDRRALYVAGAGSVICLGALALFVSAYPYEWNVAGQDASTTGVLTYAAGLVVLVGATGAALVANYIERAGPSPAEIEASADDGSPAGDVSDEQVRRDIEEAMDSADISWGGVEKTDTKRLKIQTDETDIDRSGFDNVSANETRAESSSVDDAVSGLQKLRGNERKEDTGQAVDDQANALRELRERQAAEPEEEKGLIDRVRERLGI